MSGNQSKSDRNNNEYKRSGRPNNPNSPRNFPGGGGRGGGGGGGSAVPPSSGYYPVKSYKKVVSNNAASQGVQTSRVAGSGVNPNANANVNTGGGRGAAAPNGAPVQQPLKGTPDTSAIGATVKPTDTSVPKSTPGLPKAPPSSAVPPSSGTGNATGPATPVKGSGDASKSFSLQFGSISPGVINGIQVPARTSSAPPNMDEQQRAQARLDSLKPTSYPNPPVPKQQLPRKDIGPVDQPNTIEVRPTSKEKNDILSTPPPVTSHTQKPAGPPMSSIPMQMQFRQPPLPIPFGAPNSPLQSQGMPNPALPVPFQMLSVGNPPHFVPGIPPHHQGLIHPSQGLTFPPQMGPQFGNMGTGMGFGQQFQQQQQQQQPMGNFSGGRRTVKITHPDTHEELRLDKRNDGFGNDGSAGPRPHPHGLSQAHQMNLYSNSYNTNPRFLPTQTAPGSQAPRLYNQTSKQVTVKPAVSTHGEKVGDSSPAVVKSEIPKSQRAGGEVTSTHPHKDLETVNSEAGVAKKVTVSKEEQKQPAKKDQSISTDKVDGQASSVPTSSVPVHESVDSGLQETHQSSTLSMESNKDVLETSNKLVPSSVADVSASECDNKEGLSSTEAISSGTNLDNTPEDEEGRVAEIVGSEEQVKESVVQNQDSAVTDVTVGQQKENVNYVDDKSSGSIFNADLDVLSTQTSSLNLDDGLSKNEGKDVDQVNNIEPVTLVEESHAVSVMVQETAPLTLEADATSGKVKANTGKVKKKIKVILKTADARGTTSDLYNAYKRPEEKKETLSAEIVESNTSVKSLEKDAMSNETHGPSKVEPEDWEDAADISAPKMGTGLKREDDNDGMTKKYSRDFLLKFLDQCTDLPEGFEITSDIAEALIASSINMAPHPSPGRGGVGGDRSARHRHPGNLSVDDKWNKGSVPIMGGQGWVPMGYPGRGNQGVLETPRRQPPNQYTGGIFPGQMPSPGPQGHPMQRNNSGSDRWQRATGYQQGFMPSPHTPVMHKVERKY